MQHHIHLDLQITFSSRWHTGSGEGNLSTDRLIRRDSRNRPVIPGSTLKGIIRQSCEKLSRGLACPAPSDPHQSDLTGNQAFVPYREIRSPVDRLFGTRFVPGGLFFRDAHLTDDSFCSTFSRNRIGRYRILKTSRHQQLFNTEYATKSRLLTSVDGWHRDLAGLGEGYPPYAYCLLMAGILAVERIGADRSSGSGRLEGPISITRAMYNGTAIDLADALDVLDLGPYEEMRSES